MTTPLPTAETSRRIQSVDLLRGAVMIIMAIDHVRVYSGIPAGGPDPGVFLTRWITHYCAPSFAFFAGTSAFLYYQKTQDKNKVARFLLIRGVLLVIMEITIVRFFWTFNFDIANFTLAGVIWMLGWCMVILAAFIRLSARTLVVTGLAMIAFQQVFQYVPLLFPTAAQDIAASIWGFFYPTGAAGASLSGPTGLKNIFGVSILYVLIPWIGVMMAGYGFGQILLKEPLEVRKICVRTGISAIVGFIVVGSVVILINPSSGGDLPFIFKLMGQQKYPPSQLYLLMTLGPVIALVPWAEKQRGRFAEAVKIIGKVPMFYYLMHLLLIHLSAYVVNLLVSGSIHREWYNTAPLVGMAPEDRWGLPLLYLVWLIDVVILYFVCKTYARYKSAHPEITWLKYI